MECSYKQDSALKCLAAFEDILKKYVCICLHANMFILCVKNPELQPSAVHTSEGVRWTQVSPFVVSICPSTREEVDNLEKVAQAVHSQTFNAQTLLYFFRPFFLFLSLFLALS